MNASRWQRCHILTWNTRGYIWTGQLYDIPADCHPRDLGDSDVELLGLEKKKARGLSDHRSGPSSFFWASEEDEMESAPPGVKNKLKRMIQATDCPEVVDEAGGVLEKVEERWHELPPELLVQILALVDHRTVVVATGVCSSWRQSISTGIHELSFSWSATSPLFFSCRNVAPSSRRQCK